MGTCYFRLTLKKIRLMIISCSAEAPRFSLLPTKKSSFKSSKPKQEMRDIGYSGPLCFPFFLMTCPPCTLLSLDLQTASSLWLLINYVVVFTFYCFWPLILWYTLVACFLFNSIRSLTLSFKCGCVQVSRSSIVHGSVWQLQDLLAVGRWFTRWSQPNLWYAF